MRWQRNRPLWPLVSGLTLLLALAVDAPRNWQLPPDNSASLHPAPPLPLRMDFTWPEWENAKPLPSLASPVTAPMLPPIEADSYNLDDFDFTFSRAPEQLPARSRFTIERLLDLRDAVFSLVERAPQAARELRVPAEVELPHRETVMGPPQAPVAKDSAPRTNAAPPASSAGLDDFADVLLESVRRSRETTLASTRLAMRNDVQTPVVAEATAAVPSTSTPLLRYRPHALIAHLEELREMPAVGPWADDSLSLVRQLADEPSTSPDDAPRIVHELQTLAMRGAEDALELEDHAVGYEWLRAAQSIERRTVIWRLLFDRTRQDEGDLADGSSAQTDIMPVLNAVAERLQNVAHGDEWREYLLLDQIAIAASEGAAVDVKGRRKLAQEALSRMIDRRLTKAQRTFIQTEEVVALREALRPWAIGPVDMETLAALVEHYEMHPDLRFASALTQLQQRLHWSSNAEFQQLAEHLDRHYRGANMRVAVTADLINRMMPQPTVNTAPVNEKIAGTKVRGRARTTTQVQVHLLPNEEAWQLSLEAQGAVYSRTRSETWPARVQNSARMHYSTRKVVTVDPHGMHIAPAKADARGRNDLVGIDTQFDPLPIVSGMLRDAARRRHNESRPLAQAQVKSKVARQARLRMDQEANPKLAKLSERFETNILNSIEELALVAEPLEMFTTQERAVMELRLANSTQLAASSLRPLAPADSVASVQFHESVLNNAAAGLGLDGRRMTLVELFDFLADKFGNPDATPPADMPQRAIVEFAAHDAIQIHCEDDRLELVLNIREVAKGRDKIRGFQVHAYFRPVVEGLNVRLVRDGTLQFNGRNLRTGPRVVLHTVFGKLLDKDQELPLLKRDLGDDPRLEGLMVTQLVITDGWIGLSVGPEFAGRTAWRTSAVAQH